MISTAVKAESSAPIAAAVGSPRAKSATIAGSTSGAMKPNIAGR